MKAESEGWLLLVHQLPPQPAYLRVKTWRRLQALGAVALKGSVYALPAGEQAREDFQWLLQEIVADGGEAVLMEARLIDGLDDGAAQALFSAPRTADYRQLAAEIDALSRDGEAEALRSQVGKLRKRLAQIIAIDFFEAEGRAEAEAALAGLELRLAAPAPPGPATGLSDYRGRTWVTRTGIQVDRIACAWLILRFIDPKAKFKFVAPKGYKPEPGELRFDMYEAEFTHEGDACSFEVLLQRMGSQDAALKAIAEIVHDIDLKDGRFGRDETAGVAHLLAGLAAPHRTDEGRIARGGVLFDSLYDYFKGG